MRLVAIIAIFLTGCALPVKDSLKFAEVQTSSAHIESILEESADKATSPAAAAAPAPLTSSSVEMSVATTPRPVTKTKTDRAVPSSSNKKKIDGADVLDQMTEATMSFTIPSVTGMGSPVTAELKISTLLDLAGITARDRDASYTAEIKVSRIVTATLAAPEFDITSSAPERQALSDTEDTVWQWQLKPKSPGRQTVRLSIVAAVDVAGERTQRLVRVFDRTVEVTVTPEQVAIGWLGENWQWLLSTLVLPLVIWLWRSRGKGT